MSTLTCREARRLLPAYHDGELDLGGQVAVQSHVTRCRSCAAERRELAAIRAGLRLGAPAPPGTRDDVASVTRRVIARVEVERELSLPRRVTAMFEDMHLVWAALGATAATLVCIAAVMGVARLATHERPASMAAIIGAMASPGSNRNPVAVDGRMMLPRADPDAIMLTPRSGRDDAVYAVMAVVTREGQVRNLELLLPESGPPAVGDQVILDLLDAASQARFEPARAHGAPVAVNVVWLLAHTTVRGQPGAMWDDLDGPSWRTPRLRPAPVSIAPVSRSRVGRQPVFV